MNTLVIVFGSIFGYCVVACLVHKRLMWRMICNKTSSYRPEVMMISMVISWFLLPVAIALLFAYKLDNGYFEVPPRKIRKEIERESANAGTGT